MVPKLSDLIRDWAQQNNWPLTVTPSKNYEGLVWIETTTLIPTGGGRGVPAYLATIHDDAGYVAGPPSEADSDLRPEDPLFFTKLGEMLSRSYLGFPQLDRSALPHE